MVSRDRLKVPSSLKSGCRERAVAHASVPPEGVVSAAERPRDLVLTGVNVGAREFYPARDALTKLHKLEALELKIKGWADEPTGWKTHRTSRIDIGETCDALYDVRWRHFIVKVVKL